MPSIRIPRRLRAHRLLVLLAALATAGCERAVFAFANRGLDAPESTVAYAPDRALALDVYRPRAGSTRAAPVVLFFYGGGWQRGERAQYRFVGRRLARHGVLAIVADYRTWPRAGFPAFMDDAARAAAWTRANAAAYGGDPSRVFLAGHSAGAQIAALLATDVRHLRAHGLAPRDFAGVVGLSGPYDFVISGQYRKVFGPPAQWPQAQPIRFVDGDEPPFLLVHGADDRVVESVDSAQMRDALRAAGVEATLVMLPDAGHAATVAAFYDPARAPPVLPAVLDFVDAPVR